MQRRDFLIGGSSLLLAQALRAAPKEAVGTRIQAGQIGTLHAHAAGKMQAMRAASTEWTVVGYTESNAAAAERAAKTSAYEGLPLITEKELLATKEVKVIAVETGIEDSCETALRVIRAGKHLHLDKPGSLTHAPFRSMRQEAEQRGVIVQMGYMLRYNPAFELLFSAVRSGWLGEILEIDASMGKHSDQKERVTVKALPGGSMFELGCHLIDAIHTVMGGPPQAVQSFLTPSSNDGVKDNQLAVLSYARATATVRTNLSDPFGNPRRRFCVSGTEGSFEIVPLETGQARLSLTSPRDHYRTGSQAIQVGPKEGRYDGEFRDLARVLRKEKSFAWNAEHDIAVHRSVLQASGLV